MTVPAAELLAELHALAVSVGLDDEASLTQAMTSLTRRLRGAIPSYCGLRLTLVEHAWPITLTDFLDRREEVSATSLRLQMDLVLSGADPSSTIVLYADTPGAFVDLAADVSYALNGSSPMAARSHNGDRPAIELDADLPPASGVSGLTGLAELSTINRAIGYLVDQGHLPAEAHAAIRQGAASAGLATPAFAARILRR